jgi:hypothetical protein
MSGFLFRKENRSGGYFHGPSIKIPSKYVSVIFKVQFVVFPPLFSPFLVLICGFLNVQDGYFMEGKLATELKALL